MNKDIDVDETFSPGQQIIDPKYFSGRKEEIKTAVQALIRKGTSIIIYGDRGTGKTSLVEMIKKIATGDDFLIYKHELHKSRPYKSLNFKIAEVTCDSDTNNIEKVLQRLITSPYGLKNIISSRIEKIENKLNTNLSFNIFRLFGVGAALEEKEIRSYVNEKSVIETFCNIIHAIKKDVLEKNENLLIVIDEIDLVNDKSKLSSLIKNLSQENVTFLISGIGHNYTELVEGHQSIMRQILQGRIKILPMGKEEINEIFDIASENNDDHIIFNQAFRKEVIELSEGYPYFVHLCGQLALDKFVELNGYNSKGTINTQHLIDGLEKLIEYEPLLDDLYHSLVGESAEREIMLKAIASQKSSRVRISEVYKYCEKRDIQYPKKTLTYLLSFRDKSETCSAKQVIKRVGDDYVSYEKTLFKIFVKVRKPLFEDI
ncbi:MAG: ATP-binding protein [Candidatus Cyclobacteriaceae bacterium M2_1C_046]